MKSQTLIATLLATLTTAAPTAKLQQSKPFYLTLTNQTDPTHNGLRLEVIHVSGGSNVPVFRNPAEYGTPAYFNDTRANIQNQHAYLDFDLGLAPKNFMPYSLSLPTAKEHLVPVNVVPGQNTEEFGVTHSQGMKLLYHYTLEEGAGLFACRETFNGGQSYEIALKYGAPPNFSVPKGCSRAEMAISDVPAAGQ